MDCPRCKKGLEEHKAGDVTVCVCPGCGGCWFDSGDLQRVVELRQSVYDVHEIEKMQAMHKDALATPHDEQKALVCPRCAGALTTFNYGYSSGIIADRCPACEGVWLDAGELEEIEKLVDKWESGLSEDMAHWGPTLQKTRTEVASRIQSAERRPRTLLGGLIASVLFHWSGSDSD